MFRGGVLPCFGASKPQVSVVLRHPGSLVVHLLWGAMVASTLNAWMPCTSVCVTSYARVNCFPCHDRYKGKAAVGTVPSMEKVYHLLIAGTITPEDKGVSLTQYYHCFLGRPVIHFNC